MSLMTEQAKRPFDPPLGLSRSLYPWRDCVRALERLMGGRPVSNGRGNREDAVDAPAGYGARV
jgi:hypothetical protein